MTDTAAQHWTKAYRPLMVILLVITLAALALNQAGIAFMHGFMGLFFAIFAMFKLFDLHGFATGFRTYDLIAKQWRGYAYLYPLVELGLGLAYLAHWQLRAIYSITLVLMLVSTVGVGLRIRKGGTIKCACLGTTLNVPLSTVSVIENVGMGAMAAFMLFSGQ